MPARQRTTRRTGTSTTRRVGGRTPLPKGSTDITVRLLPDGEAPAPPPKEYPAPPELGYERKMLPVRLMNQATGDPDIQGPQRNLPESGPRWEQALINRAKKYGDFEWVYLTDRVVSLREDGTHWPLDGNGSNHWIERLFGPDTEVPCRILTGLSLADENRIFQEIQDRRKAVTRKEQYDANVRFNSKSMEFKIGRIMKREGFTVSAAVNDPNGIGVTAVEWVFKYRGSSVLEDVLRLIKHVFPQDDPARTNASLIKGLSLALSPDMEFDREILLDVLRRVGAKALSANARGRASENIVLERIQKLYEDAAKTEGQVQNAGAPVAPVAFSSGLVAAAAAAAHQQPFLDASGSGSDQDTEPAVPGEEADPPADGEESQDTPAAYAGDDAASQAGQRGSTRRRRSA